MYATNCLPLRYCLLFPRSTSGWHGNRSPIINCLQKFIFLNRLNYVASQKYYLYHPAFSIVFSVIFRGSCAVARLSFFSRFKRRQSSRWKTDTIFKARNLNLLSVTCTLETTRLRVFIAPSSSTTCNEGHYFFVLTFPSETSALLRHLTKHVAATGYSFIFYRISDCDIVLVWNRSNLNEQRHFHC